MRNIKREERKQIPPGEKKSQPRRKYEIHKIRTIIHTDEVGRVVVRGALHAEIGEVLHNLVTCLLYTSDAADE